MQVIPSEGCTGNKGILVMCAAVVHAQASSAAPLAGMTRILVLSGAAYNSHFSATDVNQLRGRPGSK